MGGFLKEVQNAASKALGDGRIRDLQLDCEFSERRLSWHLEIPAFLGVLKGVSLF